MAPSVPGASSSALLPANASEGGTSHEGMVSAMGAAVAELVVSRFQESEEQFVNSVLNATNQAGELVQNSEPVMMLEASQGGTFTYLVLQLIVMLGNATLFASLGIGAMAFSRFYPPPEDEVVLEGLKASKPSIICMIPALLEHEAELIVETVRMALAVPELDKVVLAYNTKSGEVKEVLAELEQLRRKDPRLVLSHEPSSTSKAANLNAALHLTEPYELTLILDADHHIESVAIGRLVHSLRASPQSTACMQGAVLVRGDGFWEYALTTLNWYFFSILFPGVQMISGTAMFAGAGAIWRSDVLRQFAFKDGMVCEDDDLSMRVITSGLNIGVCPQAELTELAPESIHSFFRQRLRWTYGYEESLNKNLCPLICARPRASLQRIYVYSWHVMAVVWIASLVTYLTVHPNMSLWRGWLEPLAVMSGPVAAIFLCVLVMLHQNKWKRWKTTMLMIPTAFIYGNMQAALTVWARLRMICGMEWHVTRRKIRREDTGC